MKPVFKSKKLNGLTKKEFNQKAQEAFEKSRAVQGGIITANARAESGYYETDEFHEQAIKMGKARMAMLSKKQKSSLGKLANSSRTEEGKSKAGKARAAATNAIRKQCPFCCTPPLNPRNYAHKHGDKCFWKNTSEKTFFESIGKKVFKSVDIKAAADRFNMTPYFKCRASNYIEKIAYDTFRIK